MDNFYKRKLTFERDGIHVFIQTPALVNKSDKHNDN